MGFNPNSSQVSDCKEQWKSKIKKNVRRSRMFSAVIFCLLIIVLGIAILLVISLSLEETNIRVLPTVPLWPRILGVALVVFLMFHGEVWPSKALSVLYKDIKSGYQFYPKITLKLIEKENCSEASKRKLKKIVYNYNHNFLNSDVTYPDFFLDKMTQRLCQQIICCHVQRRASASSRQTAK